MKLLVIGATGGTGREIVREAVGKGYEVAALVRSAEKARSRLPDAVLTEGDARDAEAVSRALAGCEAVVSALGSGLSLFRKMTLLSEAATVLVEAMKRQDVRRLVCITGVGAGDSRGHGGFFYDRVIQPLLLRTVYHDKDRQEAVVKASGLDWVFVRPTVLNNKPATGAVRATTDLADVHGGTIARADVARFVVDQVVEDRWVGRAPVITWRK